jgi:hypothetical protein
MTRFLARRWAHLRARGGEDGSGGGMSLFLVICSIALIIVTGLVVDGGAKATALDRATRIASEAARSGLQVASVDSGEIRDVAVRREVDRYLASADATSWTTDVGDNTVVVQVTITRRTKMLSIIGIDQWTVTGTGSADAIYTAG